MTEVVELLQRLIRVDTTNPPGNETAAAELLRDYLEAAGAECELYARVPERANLVARIRGTGGGPSLALLSHTDVVLADASEWERDPFAGELVGDDVWGRGALDMKCEVAASAVALATLAREGWRGRGDLVFIAAADEEVGAGFGLEWLVEAHADAVRTDYSVNEGAGERLALGDRVVYLCATGEKMTSPFLLRVLGRSGHASMPSIADNALVKAAPLIERLGRFSVEPQLVPEVEAFFEAALGRVPAPADALAAAQAVSPLAGELVEPLLGMTVSPTMARASEKRNVVPAVCEVEIDVRLLPGQSPAEAETALRACLGEGDYELVPEVEAFFEAALGRVPAPSDALAAAQAVSPLAGELVEPLLRMTVSPTMARASEKRNVVPAVCEVEIDVRLLPGQSPAEAETALRACLGEGDYELLPLARHGGTRSAIGGPLWDAAASFVAAEEPGAALAPVCVAGFTDSHWVRDAFGTVAYGFFPARALEPEVAARLIHSANERVPVADVELGLRWLLHAARTVCG